MPTMATVIENCLAEIGAFFYVCMLLVLIGMVIVEILPQRK